LTVRVTHREGRIDGFAAEISSLQSAPFFDRRARNPLAIANSAGAKTRRCTLGAVRCDRKARRNRALHSQRQDAK
jgi:hypothetical protein